MKAETSAKLHRGMTIVGIVLCVLLVPILIVNCTLIVKSLVNQDEVPDFGGFSPLIVLTDSMKPSISSGDLIICRVVDPETISAEEEHVISFFDPASKSQSVVTHKVIEVIEKEGKLFFRTQGTANNDADDALVPEENLIGLHTGVVLAGMGHVALFMQSTPGLIVCIAVPLALLVGYDMIRRRLYESRNAEKSDDLAALRAELEALKAEKAKKEEEDEGKSEKSDAESVEAPSSPPAGNSSANPASE